MSIKRGIGECLYSHAEINQRCQELGTKISTYYTDLEAEHVGVVPVMNGAMRFCSKLLDATFPFLVSVHPLQVFSYEGTKRLEHVHFNTEKLGLEELPDHILVVEDIIDTGATSEGVTSYFKNRGKHTSLCALLQKKQAPIPKVEKSFIGFHCPDLFVVGYGLDYHGVLRDVNGIYIFNEELVANA